MYKNSAISLDAYDANVWCSVGVMLFLITLVTLFGLKWRYNSIPIMQVLTILLINEILYSLTEVLAYIVNSNNVLRIISKDGGGQLRVVEWRRQLGALGQPGRLLYFELPFVGRRLETVGLFVHHVAKGFGFLAVFLSAGHTL